MTLIFRKFAGPSYWVKKGPKYKPVPKSKPPRLVNDRGEEVPKDKWPIFAKADPWEKIQKEPE